jgi:nicotinamide phosphoribosyltransferase
MDNLVLMTDSYKSSHFLQYPEGTEGMFSYLESRGGKYDRTLFFGLQYLLNRYLWDPITHQQVDEALVFFSKHGTPFPTRGWRKVVDQHKGRLPIRIRAVPEGLVVPTHNVLMTVESLDPELFWLVTWVETMLMRLWYPITVATQSWHVRRNIKAALMETGGDASSLNFKLHDFGSRGVSSAESAGVGGASHLAAGWMGSDTVEGVVLANQYYKDDMAGFSIPASEHSTITTWGRDGEFRAFDNMLAKFGGPGKLVACVSDSFNIFDACDYWISKSEAIKAQGTTLVIRPDSGDPAEVVLAILNKFRDAKLTTNNELGYSVLPAHFRVIQGDGVNPESIKAILGKLKDARFAADNLAFGMGGALLQQVNRDTQKFAYKCSAVKVNGKWRDVYKEPVTDPGKKSKRGRLELSGSIDDGFTTVKADGLQVWNSVMHTVYEPGRACPQTTLAEVRSLANYALDKP